MLVQSKRLALFLFFFSLTEVVFVLVTCSPGCVSCTNDTCVACTQGNYLQSGSCHSCPAHCTSCNNSMVCYNCTVGYYGLLCEKNCISPMCLNNTCDKDSGACLHGCIEGYFQSGSSCSLCNPDCKTCANFSNNCLECKEGYYGPSCHYPCSRCKDGICTRDNCTYGCGDGFYRTSEACNACNEHCVSCSHYYNCQVCENGYFGPACQFMCSECSPCNQNGSCPTATGPAPSTTTQPTSSTKVSIARSLPTTIISTTTNEVPTSTTQPTSQSEESVTTSFSTTTISTTMPTQTSASKDSTSSSECLTNSSQPPTTMAFSSADIESTSFNTTTIDSKSSGTLPTDSPQRPTNTPFNSEDNSLIIYAAAAGGGAGLVVIVVVIVLVVVCNRRGRARQSEIIVESIDMTENENYISADEIDEITRKSTKTQNDVNQNKQQDNDALYAQPNKTHRPTMVTMET